MGDSWDALALPPKLANVRCPMSSPPIYGPFAGSDPETAGWPYVRGPKENTLVTIAHALVNNDTVFDSDDGCLVKYREGEVRTKAEQMEPTERIYGIHWETETELPLWQLTTQDWLRVDVTRQFDSKFRLAAYKPLTEEEALGLRARMADPGNKDDYNWKCTIESSRIGGSGSRIGYDRDIFKYTSPPGVGFDWRVTNCSRLSPGFMRWIARHHSSTMVAGNSMSAAMARHPKDAYQVQFCGVPWGIFKNYWRKPINLNRKFHDRGRSKWSKRYSMAQGAPAIEVLDFDLTMLKKERCFFADFSRMYQDKTRRADDDLEKWMLKNSRAFRILSDGDSPFVKDDTEFLFTVDWM